MKELSSKPTSIPRKLLLYALFALLVLAAVGCRRSTPFPPDTVPRFAQTVAEFTFKVGQPVSLILPAAAGGQEPLVYRLEQVPPGLAFDAATRTLSGMPTTPGTYRLPYQVVDVDGDQDTQTIIVAVPVTDCEEWNTGTFFATATLERVTDCLWAGAEVNARDRRRNTPLHFAASATDDPLIVAALLEAGADLRARNRRRGRSPAWCREQRESCCPRILAGGWCGGLRAHPFPPHAVALGCSKQPQSGRCRNARRCGCERDRSGQLPRNTAA